MGYQALLFCADEKSAQLVTQVLTELEFSVEPANEPFAAVKRLTTQHFDAVVVDCENEQNASLLFKSARNSGPNKTSLAVAVVEGQPGIAKAFRIGANLVLTKPINVEQSKGTLRVARGLLKKGDAAKPAVAMPAAPVAQAPAAAIPARPVPSNPAFARPASPAVPTLKPVVPPKSITTKPGPPAVRAEAPSMLELEAEPTPQTESTDAALLASMPEVATPAPPSLTPKAAWPPSKTGNPFTGGGTGQATGVAPAREAAPHTLEPKPVALVSAPAEPARPIAYSQPAETNSSTSVLSTPAPSGSGMQKWILIAAAILLAAAGGYFASTKMHSGSTSAPTSATNQPQPAATQPTRAQSEPAQDVTSGGPSSTASAHSAAPTSTTQAAPVSQSASQQEGSDEETPEVTKKFAAQKTSSASAEKPAQTLVVKSSASKLAQSQAEQAPQAIPITGLASNSGDKALSGIMSAAPSVRTPVLKTVKVSQGVSQGLVLKKVSPDYPAQARQLRIEGTVQLDATISKDGSVTNLKVVSGHPILARAAVDAVKQWKYRPYLLNGQAVEIDTQIAVNFKLP